MLENFEVFRNLTIKERERMKEMERTSKSFYRNFFLLIYRFLRAVFLIIFATNVN